MSDEDYGYLAGRLATRKSGSRTAKCSVSAVAHQKLADTYIAVRTKYQRRAYSSSNQQELCVPSAERGFSSYLDLRGADAHRHSPA